MCPFVSLAQKAIEEYLRFGRVIEPVEELPPEMQKRAGVFVTLKKYGRLRGCIGTFLPSKENIYREIVKNAIASATEDKRFHPVQADELREVTYSVDILSEPEKVSDISSLDPKIYGVMVVKGDKRGLILPDIEGVSTFQEQLKIAETKAGIKPGDKNIEIFRFTVNRYRQREN